MLKIEEFFGKPGWNAWDVALNGLGAVMGAKLLVGGEGSSRGIHRHSPGEKEIFVVVSGTAKAVIDGEEIHLGRGGGEVDFLVMEDEEHGIFDKSKDFQCAIIFLKPDKSA